MRVSGGSLAGRRLIGPPRSARADLRPTTDRVREALFSVLGEAVLGARVLDLYCGTGAVAIEALSRGADSAVLIDNEVRLAQSNLDALGLSSRVELRRGDVGGWLERLIERDREARFDLIFCDPPYNIADRVGQSLQHPLAALLAPTGRVVLEGSSQGNLEFKALARLDRRSYGATRLTFYASPDTSDQRDGEQ